MADDNKLLREEETCKTDNSVLLYTISALLHIQILLHTVQPDPVYPFPAAQPETQNLLVPRNQNPEPKTSSRRATRTQNPRPPRAARSESRTQNVPDSSRSVAACHYSDYQAAFPTLRIDTFPIMGEESFKHSLGNICLFDHTNYSV